MNTARTSSGQRGRGARVVRRVLADTARGLALAGRTRVLRDTGAAVGTDRVRLGRQRWTVEEVRALAAGLAIARGPCPVLPGRALRFLWGGLTVLNAVAVAVALGSADGPTWFSAVSALVVSGVQVRLAFDVGRRLLPFAGRETAAGLPMATVAEAGALVGVGALAGTASFSWATHVQEGTAGVLCGLTLVASALAAPLLIVHGEVYGPGPRGRTLGRCERVLGRADHRCRTLGRRADRLTGAAARRLRRAEELLVLAADLLGDDDPVFVRLEAAVTGLRRAVADLTPPLDPADLDLAG